MKSPVGKKSIKNENSTFQQLTSQTYGAVLKKLYRELGVSIGFCVKIERENFLLSHQENRFVKLNLEEIPTKRLGIGKYNYSYQFFF